MKIVSVVVFAVALIGSWYLVRRTAPVAESMHVSIQNDLKRIIGEYVQQHLPNSKNLRFDKFWTETVKKDQVRAFFSYSFEDASQSNGVTVTEITGSALLNKVSENSETVTWSMDELKIKDNAVEFEDPIQITSTGPAKTEAPAPAKKSK